jgi:WD40 repeat protein/serine/threonine protein kinase
MTREEQLQQLLLHYRGLLASGQAPSLTVVCQDCPELAGDLERLVATMAPVPPPADVTASTPTELHATPTAARPDVPGYEILEVLGEGGMGIVYKARQVHANRIVALKMIAAEVGPRADPARLLLEARAIASLQHPNIVQVFEVGTLGGQDGRAAVPFFSLEYCGGGSLDRKLAGTPLPGREAATLVETLARAAHAAHQAGIVHRDLKPANVLLSDCHFALTESDEVNAKRQAEARDDFVAKITDFGLARFVGEAGQTRTGAVMGTPSYMAPEQAQGHRDVGPQADIYALGAILYECLTGRPPFKAVSGLDTLLQVINQEPVPPRQLNPMADRDLETICLKCLEKQPQRRPGSALELAEELRRFLDGKPILSRPVSRAERLARWARRNPLLAAATSLTALALMGVLVLAVAFAARERRHGNELRDALHGARRQLAENSLDRALIENADVEPDERLLWLARALEATPPDSYELEQAIRLNLAAWRRALHGLRGSLAHDAVVQCVAFGPSGRQLLTGCGDGTTRLWDTKDGQPAGLPRKHPHPVLAVAFADQGRPLALLADEDEGLLVDARTGKPVAGPFRHEAALVAAAFSRDGKRLITGSADLTARVWDVATGRGHGVALKHDTSVIAVALAADGRSALTGTLGRTAQRWSLPEGAPLGPPLVHPEAVTAVAFSADGRLFATGCGDHTARIWDGGTGRLAGSPIRHRPDRGAVRCVLFDPTSTHLLTAGSDGTARLWDLESRQSVGQSLAHQDEVRAAAFSADGRLVATGGFDQVARYWQRAAAPFVGPLDHDHDVRAGAFSPDGRYVVTVGEDHTARLWNARTGQPALAPLLHPEELQTVAFAPDGRSFLTGCDDGTARRWSVESGKLVQSYPHGGALLDVAFDARGQWIATAGSEHRGVVVWDTATARRLHLLPHGEPVRTAVFSARGDELLTGCSDGNARLWDHRSGRLVATYRHGGEVWAALYHPDRKRLLTASDDRHGRVWSISRPDKPDFLLPHLQQVRSLACSRDGRWLATASLDHTARVWDAATGEPLTRPLRHRQGVIHVVFQPTLSPLLASAGVDGAARLWAPALGRPVGPALTHQDVVMMLAFDPAGRTLLSCSRDGKGRLWPVPAPLSGEPERIVLWTETLTGKTLDAGGAVRFLEPSSWQRRWRSRQDSSEPLP